MLTAKQNRHAKAFEFVSYHCQLITVVCQTNMIIQEHHKPGGSIHDHDGLIDGWHIHFMLS